MSFLGWDKTNGGMELGEWFPVGGMFFCHTRGGKGDGSFFGDQCLSLS